MDVKQLKEKLIAAQGAQENLEVLDEIAACYYDQDKYQEAVTYYGKAEKLAPEGNPRAYFQGMEGICQFFLNNDQEAHKALLSAKNMLRLR